MLTNKSRIKNADKTFKLDAVIFCFPVSVANEIIFCYLIGLSNRRESCEHSSVNFFRSFSPFLNTFNKNLSVESIAANPVPIL